MDRGLCSKKGVICKPPSFFPRELADGVLRASKPCYLQLLMLFLPFLLPEHDKGRDIRVYSSWP